MHLKLEDLKQVARRTMKEAQHQNILREELFRVFGPPVMVSGNFDAVTDAVNEQLDLLEATRQPLPIGVIRTAVLIEAAKHTSPHVRKVAARLLPEKFLSSFLSDRSSIVRCAAARRLPYESLREALRRNPGDDQLHSIARSKRLLEAGLPTPKPAPQHLDMYTEPLGDAVKQKDPLEDMTDAWYERMAEKLCNEYGRNLEGQWEEVIATRVSASYYATSGVKIDREKLLGAIYKCIEDRDAAVMGECSLRSIADRLMRESYMDAPTMPVIEEHHDAVAELLESNVSASEYVTRAEALFEVRKATVPAGIKKYRIGEGYNLDQQVPVKGSVPRRLDHIVESALDRYVEKWNDQQSRRGEPFRISWSPSPVSQTHVSFQLELK